MFVPYLRAPTLDDLLRAVVQGIQAHGHRATASRGDSTELVGVALELENPRARLSRTETRGRVFSALGEFCWYMSGRNDHDSIAYYLPDAYRPEDINPDGTLPGAYGPRLVGESGQLDRVISLLRDRPSSRQAVLRLFDANDLATGQKDVPCTCTIQFLNREAKLHVVTNMRSNDVYLGLPHDVFCFTLLQEWVARRLRLEVGVYKQLVGSLHLYDRNQAAASGFLGEGFQTTLMPMPAMPLHDPEGGLRALLDAESALRTSAADFAMAQARETSVEPYWADLIRLLGVYRYSKDGDAEAISRLKQSMSSKSYEVFVDRQMQRIQTSKSDGSAKGSAHNE